jgi:SAM-dependent methyltransferase
MNWASLRGLRYPDEYVIRMFFKEGLAKKPGRILELGCGSANNLMLFGSHGWDVTGIDVDANILADARHNLTSTGIAGALLEHDLGLGLPKLQGSYEALLVPSVLYYIERDRAKECMRQASRLLSPNAIIYLRMRLPDDHRVGRGREVGVRSWRLDCDYTGERGALNVFGDEYELVEMLKQTFSVDVSALTRLRVSFENPQNGVVVRNSDIVIWGRVAG